VWGRDETEGAPTIVTLKLPRFRGVSNTR